MTKKVKKVDVKKVAKDSINKVIISALLDAGYTTNDGVDFGFSGGTVVVHTDNTDVQIKLITPKAGVDRYTVLETEDEVEATPETDKTPEPDAAV